VEKARTATMLFPSGAQAGWVKRVSRSRKTAFVCEPSAFITQTFSWP
jgi:hypothetical protein